MRELKRLDGQELKEQSRQFCQIAQLHQVQILVLVIGMLENIKKRKIEKKQDPNIRMEHTAIKMEETVNIMTV